MRNIDEVHVLPVERYVSLGSDLEMQIIRIDGS